MIFRATITPFSFLAGFILTSSCLKPVLPKARIPTVSEKISCLQEHGDEFDVIFIGTSRIYHQIIPGFFDRLMSEAGLRTHSYNLGIDGLRTPEDNYILETALHGRKQRLRWIIMEGNDINFRMDDILPITDRSVYWHDLRRMWVLAERFFRGSYLERTPLNKRRFREICGDLPVFAVHAELWEKNEGSAGVLCEPLFRWMNGFPWRENLLTQPVDGYLKATGPEMAPSEALAYEQELAKLALRPPEGDCKDSTSQHLLRRNQELAQRYGGELLLLIPPTLRRKKIYACPLLWKDS